MTVQDNSVSTSKADKKLDALVDKYMPLIGAGICIVLILLMEGLRGLTDGGYFSLLRVGSAIRHHASVIDVDENALRFFVVSAIAVVLGGIGFAFQPKLAARWQALVMTILVFGLGFTLDGYYGRRVLEGYMASHGYSRCTAGDRDVGSGKSRTWLAAFVADRQSCPARPAVAR